MQQTTVHDLAREVGVSSTTVWRALHGTARVSARTRERVRAAARRLNYRPSLVAKTLSTGKTQTLGVVVPMIGNPVHAALVRGVEQVAFEREYSIVLCDTDFRVDRERAYLDLLGRRRVEGVVIVRFVREEGASLEPLARLREEGAAVVAMQLEVPGDGVLSVVPDNVNAARAMTRHLIGLGHRRVAFLHGGVDSWNVPMRQRLAGYREALEEAGIGYEEELVCQAGSFEAFLSEDSADFWPERVGEFIRNVRPTAVFAPIDVLAVKVMHLVQTMGLKVPGDVAVAGFDDILMSGYTTPALTTVRQPSIEVGRRAAVRLFEQLAGVSKTETRERVPCELVIRKSCGG